MKYWRVFKHIYITYLNIKTILTYLTRHTVDEIKPLWEKWFFKQSIRLSPALTYIKYVTHSEDLSAFFFLDGQVLALFTRTVLYSEKLGVVPIISLFGWLCLFNLGVCWDSWSWTWTRAWQLNERVIERTHAPSTLTLNTEGRWSRCPSGSQWVSWPGGAPTVSWPSSSPFINIFGSNDLFCWSCECDDKNVQTELLWTVC